MSIVKFANAYITDRLYGGPEEGGWWYDTGEPVMSLPFICNDEERKDDEGNVSYEYDNHSRNLAYEKLYDLCEAAGIVVPLREKFQRRDWDTNNFKFYIEDKPGEYFPEVRPHYE